MNRPFLHLLLVALIAGGPRLLGAGEIEIYRPLHRSPADLVEVAQGLLEPGGSAGADPSSGALVLRGPREALDQALDALRQLDLPPPSYRIETRMTDREQIRRGGLEVRGWIDTGPLRIGRVAAGPAGPGVVFHSLATGREHEADSTFSILEGQGAEIWTGDLQPALVRIHREPGAGVRELEVIPSASSRTGIRVRPRGLADGSIELELTPVIGEPGPGTVQRQTAAAARIRLRPGESCVIASREGLTSHTLSAPLAGRWRKTGTEETSLWVRVTREDPDPGP